MLIELLAISKLGLVWNCPVCTLFPLRQVRCASPVLRLWWPPSHHSRWSGMIDRKRRWRWLHRRDAIWDFGCIWMSDELVKGTSKWSRQIARNISGSQFQSPITNFNTKTHNRGDNFYEKRKPTNMQNETIWRKRLTWCKHCIRLRHCVYMWHHLRWTAACRYLHQRWR